MLFGNQKAVNRLDRVISLRTVSVLSFLNNNLCLFVYISVNHNRDFRIYNVGS